MDIVYLDPSCAWDPDIDRVAQLALSRLPESKREQGGVLYKNAQGEYCFSTAVTGQKDRLSYKVAKVPDSKVAGLYHTHPVGHRAASQFSPEDTEVAKNLGVPSYLKLPTGDIRKLADVKGLPGHRHGELIFSGADLATKLDELKSKVEPLSANENLERLRTQVEQ